ncbi:TRAFAC clade GTPase domain-containing protein [Burkholderia gladioli]|uniref:TRAFAC clade GTPase domain-containing protein n=1 Tax=Burkholderia gladioli TaxID=28095 RepID=UPI002652D44D|nr:hypothetical protein [Burkholderia gladioli]MDN7752663.1 hypothetical protein [Burkholderia gladioli]
MEITAGITQAPTGNCTTAGCNAPLDRCIEGLSLEECPNFVIGEEVEEVSIDTRRQDEPETVVRISRGGRALSVDEADDCMLSAPSGRRLAVICLVGVPDSGKTTLLASLYEIVRRNLAAELGFVGSETIQGFEERCHLSRLTSENETPDTPRTSRELQFLHLSVLAKQTGTRVELFMTDRRGEQFQDVLDRPALSETLTEVRRGDNIGFLLDGEHLIDPDRRESAISKVVRLAMALKTVVRQSTGVQLVVTKRDKIHGNDDETFVRKRVETVSEILSGIFGTGIRFSLHYTAARDLDGNSNGMSELLAEWLRTPDEMRTEAPNLPLGNNFFERLMNLRSTRI